MKAKHTERAEAIRLRVEGRLSLNEIEAQVAASRGSLSTWLRPYPLSAEEVVGRRRRPRKQVLVSNMVTPKTHPTLSTNAKGHIAILKVEARAIELGAIVSRPSMEGGRYDLVIDYGGKLFRVQVKYADGNPGNCVGTVYANLSHGTRSGKLRKTGYAPGEVDALLVYVPKVDKIVWLDPCQFEDKGRVYLRYGRSLVKRLTYAKLVEDHIW